MFGESSKGQQSPMGSGFGDSSTWVGRKVLFELLYQRRTGRYNVSREFKTFQQGGGAGRTHTSEKIGGQGGALP